jgi:hypothetical protein
MLVLDYGETSHGLSVRTVDYRCHCAAVYYKNVYLEPKLIFSESCDKRYAHEIEQAGSEFQ